MTRQPRGGPCRHCRKPVPETSRYLTLCDDRCAGRYHRGLLPGRDFPARGIPHAPGPGERACGMCGGGYAHKGLVCRRCSKRVERRRKYEARWAAMRVGGAE